MFISILVISVAGKGAGGAEDGLFTPCKSPIALVRRGNGGLSVFCRHGLSEAARMELDPLRRDDRPSRRSFFAPAIQNVHRWYKVPVIGFAFQPSEYAKLVVVSP